MDDKKTAGQFEIEARLAGPPDHTPHDQALTMLTDKDNYDKQIHECIEIHSKLWGEDFYVIVELRKDPVLVHILRQIFAGVRACPHPAYDQTVYKFHYKEQRLELIWCVPAMDICEYFYVHPEQAHPEERDLMRYITQFYDGTLKRKSDELNHLVRTTSIILPESYFS